MTTETSKAPWADEPASGALFRFAQASAASTYGPGVYVDIARYQIELAETMTNILIGIELALTDPDGLRAWREAYYREAAGAPRFPAETATKFVELWKGSSHG